MSIERIIEGALTTYLAGQALEPTPERLRELAAFISNHLDTGRQASRTVVVHVHV